MTIRVAHTSYSATRLAAGVVIALSLGAGAAASVRDASAFEPHIAAVEQNADAVDQHAAVGEQSIAGVEQYAAAGGDNSADGSVDIPESGQNRSITEHNSGVFLQPECDPGGMPMTGNLQVDLFGLTEMRDGPALELLLPGDDGGSAGISRKSPWLAAGMSLLVPGTGEFYAGSYWKAALFFAVEVAALAAAYSYDRRGDQQTDRYQDFANKNWSAVKYAKYAETLVGQEEFNWRIPGTEGMDEFDRSWTQVNWAELNRMERYIAGYYSHTLPPYGEQQYFELIGKYPQYNQGWNDAPSSFNYGDPLTPNFQFYSGERGKANDYYSSASSWVTVVIVNHVLSAIDAAWSAHLHNRAQASVSMRMIPTQEGYAPVGHLTVRYNF